MIFSSFQYYYYYYYHHHYRFVTKHQVTMAKFFCCILLSLVCLNKTKAQISTDGDDFYADSEVLPVECLQQLNEFAEYTSDFTKCVISNAQPIRVCENCTENYNLVAESYRNIQQPSTKKNCRDILTNIDRLQVVHASYNYVESLWEDASCKSCLESNGIDINIRTKEILDLEKSFGKCLFDFNSTYCDKCKQSYLDLTDYYDRHKNLDGYCMDVVDLVNKTQFTWNKNCHDYKENVQWTLLIISFIALLMPVLFYLINWHPSLRGSYELLSRNQHHNEPFTNNIASTSGYVVIS